MSGGQVPAPALRETAEVWWDTTVDPVVVWDPAGSRFELVDGADERNRLQLWWSPAPAADAEAVARALAEHLAACDFPPTGDGADAGHVRAALRAAGIAG